MRYLICLFILSGCAAARSHYEHNWKKDGVSDAEMSRTVRSCAIDSSPGVIAYAVGGTIPAYFDECMTGKGFTKAK